MSDFQSLVDHTRVDLVRRLVNGPGSPVTDLILVESDELMCEATAGGCDCRLPRKLP